MFKETPKSWIFPKTLAIDNIYPAWKYESCICARTETKCSTGVAPPPQKKKHLFGATHLFGGKLKNIAFLKLKMSSSLVALVLLHSWQGLTDRCISKLLLFTFQIKHINTFYSKKLTQSKIMDVKCQTTFNLIYNVYILFAHKEVATT